MLFPGLPSTDLPLHRPSSDSTTDPSYSSSVAQHTSGLPSPMHSPRPSLTSIHQPPFSQSAQVTASLVELTETSLNKQATPTQKMTTPTHKPTSLSHKLPSSKQVITDPRKTAPVHKQSTPTDTHKGHGSKRQSPKVSPLHSAQDHGKLTENITSSSALNIGSQAATSIVPTSLPLTTGKGADKTASQPAPTSASQAVELSDVLHALAVEELTSISRNMIQDQQQTDALPGITTTTVTSNPHTTTPPSPPPTITSTVSPTIKPTTAPLTTNILSPSTTSRSGTTSLSSMNSSFSELQSISPIPQPSTKYSAKMKDTATKPRERKFSGKRACGGGIQKGADKLKEGARQADRKKGISELGKEKEKQSATSSQGTFSLQHSVVSSKSPSDAEMMKENKQFTSSSGGGVMVALQQESQRWQTAWEEERERVRLLEEKLVQAERREGRSRVAHSQQLTDLQHKLLTAKVLREGKWKDLLLYIPYSWLFPTVKYFVSNVLDRI